MTMQRKTLISTSAERRFDIARCAIKRWVFRSAAMLLASSFFILCPALIYPQILFEGAVIRVSDGDTLIVRAGEVNFRVRLHGIDAPERGQAYGTKARDILAGMVTGAAVTIKVMDVDRYGRLIGMVYAGPLLVNLELLKQGYAWHYTEYDDTAEFARAEAEARKQKRGLWAEPSPIPPWEWRRRE